ncbi:short chain dehydrogenase [Asanoa ishikariensis]|uniref:NADP-dependent 3-hydroxy acid dehydrogenase YdfG n=1 Tax=Asanoa ishikariensis TaxID=137265 RepID=A0A1H3S2Y5_9ACTN|nr:short chain dehydrogenase [Asanoa ishikariensis]GIF66543.1 short chain dehydrogenase [Asanoa ishikariensis]SDZ32366.1 NADP-dependent 3-hydroxy acid dehydrogenase YdfG [Asanoa ishikariensis]
MKVILVGSGAIGAAVRETLETHGHEVVTVGRTSGAHQADLTDKASLDDLFARLAPFDAVASAAGEVSPGPLAEASDQQWADSIAGKGMGQINLVRAALPHIADGGSFTLVSGVLSDEYTHHSTLGSTVNHMVEGFVKAAATELPRGLRINCVSPTVLTESTHYYPFFPGFAPVPAAEVGLAYLRAIANPITGRILRLHKTNS